MEGYNDVRAPQRPEPAGARAGLAAGSARRHRGRLQWAALIAFCIGLVCTIPVAFADDTEIYTNPAANTLQPPYTVIVLDLNLLGICNSVLTQTSNPNNPSSPQLCLNVTSSIVLSDLLAGVTSNPATYLTNLLLGAYPCTGSTSCDSSASGLCNLYGILGVASPVVQIPALGPLLQPLLGGITTLSCSTLSTLLSIPLLGSTINSLLGGFVGQLVTGLVSPLLTTVVGQLPTAIIGLLQTTISGVLTLGQTSLTSLLGSILSNLINTNVAIMVSHADRADTTGSPASSCIFANPRRNTPTCSNGAYMLIGFLPLANQSTVTTLLNKVTSLLTNMLSPSNLLTSTNALLATALTTPASLLPPYQGKEVYDELAHYLAGNAVFNAPLNYWDGLTGLLPRDTTIESGGNYVKPALACRTANVLNILLTNNIRDSESDADLRTYFPSLPSGTITLGNVVSAAAAGFQSNSNQTINLRSFFLIQNLLTSTSSLANAGATITTYADSLGLLGLGASVASLLKPVINVDASLLTPSLTNDITQPGKIRPEAFFSEFKPDTGQNSRWNGNLKKLTLKTDSSGNYQYYDANGALAIASDGRISTTALTYWTNSGLLGTGISADGRTTTLGGAGQHVPGFALSGGGNPGRYNADPSTAPRTLYYDHIASGAFNLGTLDANTSTSTAVTELVPDLLGAGTAPTATYETAANCGTAKTAAQVAQETLLYSRGFDTGTSCTGSKGSTSVVGRSWLEGAVLHSRPVSIDYGARSGYSVTSPDIRVVYGSADGFMRMVRNTDGVESWGFMPRVTMAQQVQLRNNTNDTILPYGVDGAPAVLIQDRQPGQTTGAGDGIIDSGNPNDHAWMFFGLRRSGIFQNSANRGYYYAMDVTNPDSPTLMWRIGPDGLYNSSGLVANSASNYAELGLTFSAPQIGRMMIGGVSKPVLFFGGGYNGGRDSAGNRLGKDYYRASAGKVGTDDTSVVTAGPDGILGTADDVTTVTNVGNAIYIVDAQTGALIWKAVYSATYTAGAALSGSASAYVFKHPLLTNGIASDLTIADTDGDGFTDRLYVADTGGRLWRGDFTGTDASKWTLSPLASVGRYRNNDIADDRRFYGAPDYAPVRSTVSTGTNYGNYDEITFGSGDREDPLDTSTINYFYAYRDYRTASGPPTTVLTSDSALQGTGSSAGNDFIDLTSACAAGAAGCANSYNLSTGWKIQLSGSGEKVFNQPLSSSGDVFFSTYTPPNASTLSCTPSEGTSTVYGITLADSRPLVGVLNTSTTATRSVANATPGLPGEVNTLGANSIGVNTQNFNLPTTPNYVIYWRERRNDEAVEIPQPQQ